MVKVGVIGAGKWGKNHVRVYSQMESCELIGIADKNPEQKALAEEFKTKFFTDYNDLLEKVDAVSVVVPTDLHYMVVKDCLNAGKHVLVEKPITLKASQTRELVQLAHDKHLILAGGYLFRFNAAVQEIRKRLKDLGDIQYITMRYIHSSKPPRTDSGVIFNLAAHPIDILNFVLGQKPKKIYCKKINYLRPELEDVGLITFDYGKFIVNLEVSCFHPLKKRDIWIIGSKIKMYSDLLEQIVTIYPLEITKEGVKKLPAEDLEIHKNEPLKEELKYFCNCVENHRFEMMKDASKMIIDDEADLTTYICEQCLKSAEEGVEIDLDAQKKKNGTDREPLSAISRESTSSFSSPKGD